MVWWLLAVVIALVPLTLGLRVHWFGRRERPLPHADAIVVLGARVLPPATPSNALRSRVECAAKLFHAGAAPLVLFTGGGTPSEAAVACELAASLGVSRDACVLEEASLSTAENAREAKRLLAARGASSLVLVTDDYHLLRATSLFRTHALTVHPVAATRPMTTSDRLFWTAREVIALLRRPWQIS